MLSQEFHFVAKWIGAVPRHYFAFDSMTNEEKSFLLPSDMNISSSIDWSRRGLISILAF